MNNKAIKDLLEMIDKYEIALKEIAAMEKGPYFYSDRFYQMKQIAQNTLENK